MSALSLASASAKAFLYNALSFSVGIPPFFLIAFVIGIKSNIRSLGQPLIQKGS